MAENDGWEGLLNVNTQRQVFLGRSFRRPEEGDSYIQYLHEGNEYISVRTDRPYGALTEMAQLPAGDSYGLMPVTHVGSDYATVSVPDNSISLRAATLGNANRQPRAIRDIYRQAGEVIGRVSEITSVPALRVGDLAVRRASGQVMFVPPVHFGALASSDPSFALDSLTTSLRAELSGVVPQSDIVLLTQDVISGINKS